MGGRALSEHVHTWLDRHTAPGRPIALACSGGGDSVALLLLAAAWAHRRERRLIVLTVDHGLRSESAAEAAGVVRLAGSLGHDAQILEWTAPRPGTGIQAAARHVRHGLLADAARAAGAGDILLAHTQDDQAETVWMRLAAGGGWRGCGGMAPVAPSPVWPQGRGMRVLRPLLDTSRAALRVWLRGQGAAWCEDPGNADDRYTRVRVRKALYALRAAGFDDARLSRLARDVRAVTDAERRAAARLAGRVVRVLDWGGIRLDARELAAAGRTVRHRVIEAACLAVSGRQALPARSAVERIDAALTDGEAVTAGGVMTGYWQGGVWLVRDPGAVSGRGGDDGAGRIAGAAAHARTWDGRFTIAGLDAGDEAGVLGVPYDGLEDRAILDSVPGFARPGLLAVRRRGRVIAVAGLMPAPADAVQLEPLGLHRFCTRLLPGGAPLWFDTGLTQ